MDLSLALLHGKGDNIEVHSVATELDILGRPTALLVAADQAALHVHSVSVQHKGEVTRAGLLPHLHPLTSKRVLKYDCDEIVFSINKRPLTARMEGTRRRMPNEITEVLMVKEPLVDLARVVLLGGIYGGARGHGHLTQADMGQVQTRA